MTKDILIFDTECNPRQWYLGFKRKSDGKRFGFELSDRSPNPDRDKVRRAFKNYTSVGFNSINYDMPMVALFLAGADNAQLKEANDRIILGNIPYWKVEDALGIKVPKFDHIDLYETNPAVKTGLKALNGRMHMKRLQELPYGPDEWLTYEQMDETIEYCQFGDIDGTEHLFDLMQEPIALREAMGKTYYDIDFRSKSDAQMGEQIIKAVVEDRKGARVKKAEIPAGTKFRYQVPDWMRFETPYMQWVLEQIAKTDFVIGESGKVDFPDAFKDFDIVFGGMKYALGIGGLHSTESKRGIRSTNSHILIDADVASQYPSIIMKLGLYPKALGKEFLSVYGDLLARRLAAKKAGDKVTDKGLKISINGAYGKLGSPYSVLFAPHLMIAVTLTGQLSLLMLIEKAVMSGIDVVSGNTDGVVFYCPREKFNGFVLKDGKPTDRLNPSPLQDIIDWWETTTSFKMEFAEYEAIYSASVNTYMAFKPGGKVKRKGDLANHWHPDSPDYDPTREMLKKNPQVTVCADAAMAYIRDGADIGEFIRNYTDVRGFIRIIKADGGATWREDYVGKLVRYYWSTDGDPIIKVKAHAKTGRRPKVPETDGSKPLMELPDDLLVPADVDYERYVRETNKILEEIGYYGLHSQQKVEYAHPLIRLLRQK